MVTEELLPWLTDKKKRTDHDQIALVAWQHIAMNHMIGELGAGTFVWKDNGPNGGESPSQLFFMF